MAFHTAAVAAYREGDEWLRVAGIKMAIDGGFEGGWMREPYAEPWGERGTYFGVHAERAAFVAGPSPRSQPVTSVV